MSKRQYCTKYLHSQILLRVIKNCRVLHPGTRLRFHRGPNVEWQEADELGDSDDDSDDDTMMPSSPSIKVKKLVPGLFLGKYFMIIRYKDFKLN